MRNNLLLLHPHKNELDLLSENFRDEYNVFTAGNAAEGMHLVDTVPVQLIICSVETPALNGWELCSRLKSSLHYSHIPFILLTADDTLSAKIKHLESGADAYVSRPFSIVYMQVLIRNLLTNRAKITAYFTCSQFETTSMAAGPFEGEFIKKLHDHIFNNVHNSSLNVDLLARFMNMSRPTFYRKIKSITDLTPNDLINIARLKQAARLLESAEYKVNEIARMTGFHSQSSFGKAFIKQFKVTPTEYQRMKRRLNLPTFS